MTLQRIIDLIRSDGGSWAIVMMIGSCLIEFTPIKLNPISAIFKWLSSKLNSDILVKIDEIDKKLDNHIKESETIAIRELRLKILDFGNSCLNSRKHTKEEFDYIISECDKYETYCRENKITNGVAKATIKEIRRIYSDCLRDNSFL